MSKNKPPLIYSPNNASSTPTNKNTDSLNPVKSGSNTVHNVQTANSPSKLYYSQPTTKPLKQQTDNKPELPKLNVPVSQKKSVDLRQPVVNEDILKPVRSGSSTVHNIKTSLAPNRSQPLNLSERQTRPSEKISEKPETFIPQNTSKTEGNDLRTPQQFTNENVESKRSIALPTKLLSNVQYTAHSTNNLPQPDASTQTNLNTGQYSLKAPQPTCSTPENFQYIRTTKTSKLNSLANTTCTFTEGIPTLDRIFDAGNNTVIVDTDKEVFINTYQYTTDQNYIKNIVEGGTALNVGFSDSSNVYNNIVSNVTELAFDVESGFTVVGLGTGEAKVVLGSIFKNWQVNGQPGITSEGTDTVNFIAGAGVEIFADNTSATKSITITSLTGNSGYSGARGISGYSGMAGDAGTSGYSGATGADGVSGFSGYSGVTGADGLSGYSGYSGIAGVQGASGYSGLAGQANLIWTENGVYRTLTGYRSNDDTVSPVRTAEFFNNLLRLTLASFTPTLTATAIPSTATLNWDVPVTGFTVTVINPNDILDQYISNVSYLTAVSGTVAPLANFTAGAKSAVPAPTIDWTQTFTNGATGFVRSNSSTIAGGTSVTNIYFKYFNGSSEVEYTSGNAVLTVNWNTPTMTMTLGTLSGTAFISSYTSVPYTITVTNVTNASNYAHNITPTGGVISNPNGSGTFTFTTPINKNNISDARILSNTTVFTRPVSVTGTSYTANITVTTTNPTVTFTYPTLWVWTTSTFIVPVRSTFVLGTGWQPGVTVLGNQVKIFAAYVNNTDVVPRGFWFAVRSAASQPTVFKTGASPSLLSDVTVTTGNTVLLEPDSPPVGLTPEQYTLYGITLQPGSTYVSIS